ncbi:hypothetical protein MCW82_14340 [Azospirillum doebereinerae]|nr:hypothetical protein [Azospirillum doebereinerae]MCG5240951.1 hypothetical protein [Azospirillum doebereinerae]
MPPPTSGRSDPTSIQGLGDSGQCRDPGSPDLVDDRQHLGRVFVGHSPSPVGTDPGDIQNIRAAQTLTTVPLGLEGGSGPIGDELAFLLGQGSPEVEGEWVHVDPELGHDELDPVTHQSGDEMNITAEPVQLGHDQGAFPALGLGNGRVQSWPVIVTTGHHVAVEIRDDEPGISGEPGNSLLLSIETESRPPLFTGRYPDVPDALHMTLRRQKQTQEERLDFVFSIFHIF